MLYKKLNEKRTQGEAKLFLKGNGEIDRYPGINLETENDSFSLVVFGQEDDWAGIRGETHEKAIANARYTVLAVNNLHHLAEALKPLANLDLTGVNGNIIYQRDNTCITVADVESAKQALARIS